MLTRLALGEEVGTILLNVYDEKRFEARRSSASDLCSATAASLDGSAAIWSVGRLRVGSGGEVGIVGRLGGGIAGGERKLSELCKEEASEVRRDSAVSESSEKRETPASRLYLSAVGGVLISGRAPAGFIWEDLCFDASEDMDVRRVDGSCGG